MQSQMLFSRSKPPKLVDIDALMRGPLPEVYERIALLKRDIKYFPRLEAEWREKIDRLLDALDRIAALDPDDYTRQLRSAARQFAPEKPEYTTLERLAQDIEELFRLVARVRNPE